LGLFILSILAELFIMSFNKKHNISATLSFVILILDYMSYCMLKTSFIVYPLFTADNRKDISDYILYIIYALIICVIIYIIISIFITKKSFFGT
jgi:phosphotransferase system  glucose/maltose/N-acetylglucosamine-specific IIC component